MQIHNKWVSAVSSLLSLPSQMTTVFHLCLSGSAPFLRYISSFSLCALMLSVAIIVLALLSFGLFFFALEL